MMDMTDMTVDHDTLFLWFRCMIWGSINNWKQPFDKFGCYGVKNTKNTSRQSSRERSLAGSHLYHLSSNSWALPFHCVVASQDWIYHSFEKNKVRIEVDLHVHWERVWNVHGNAGYWVRYLSLFHVDTIPWSGKTRCENGDPPKSSLDTECW